MFIHFSSDDFQSINYFESTVYNFPQVFIPLQFEINPYSKSSNGYIKFYIDGAYALYNYKQIQIFQIWLSSTHWIKFWSFQNVKVRKRICSRCIHVKKSSYFECKKNLSIFLYFYLCAVFRSVYLKLHLMLILSITWKSVKFLLDALLHSI